MPRAKGNASSATKPVELEKPIESDERVDLEEENDPEEEMDEEVEYEEVEEEEEVEEIEEEAEEEEVEVEEEEEEVEVEEEDNDDNADGTDAHKTLDGNDTMVVDQDEKKKQAELLALPPHGSEVYIGGIPHDASEEDLRTFCESIGEVTEVNLTAFPPLLNRMWTAWLFTTHPLSFPFEGN